MLVDMINAHALTKYLALETYARDRNFLLNSEKSVQAPQKTEFTYMMTPLRHPSLRRVPSGMTDWIRVIPSIEQSVVSGESWGSMSHLQATFMWSHNVAVSSFILDSRSIMRIDDDLGQQPPYPSCLVVSDYCLPLSVTSRQLD